MQDGRVRKVIAVIVGVIAIASGGIIYGGRHTQPAVVVTGTQPATPDPSTGDPGISSTSTPDAVPTDAAFGAPASQGQQQSPANLIYVHVAGAVKHPDLYTLPPGSRVAGALKAAGGPTADADIDAINLAEKVVDGEKVYVPRKGETVPEAVAPGNTIGLASSTPADTTVIPTTSTLPPTETRGHSHRAGRSPGHAANKLTDPSQGKVNINTAGAEELERLPGVGPATAARIIDYRKQNGGFKSPTDLMDIGGIGEKKMAKIAPFITVR